MANFVRRSRALATAALLLLPHFAQQAFAQTTNASAIDVFSHVRGLGLTAVFELPIAPTNRSNKATAGGSTSSQSQKGDQDEGCVLSPEIQPKTEAGKLVAARGWHVTAEEKIGRRQAVSFAGKFERGTSGNCTAKQGNIGIFSGSSLVAIAYAVHSSEPSISKFVPLENGDLRIWDGDLYIANNNLQGLPIADLVVQDDGALRLVPLSLEETFCQGKVRVPNIYLQPIDRARKMLIAAGWTPKPVDDDDGVSDPRARKLAEKGMPEVKACSMGLAFCWFHYAGTFGTLEVTTQGELNLPAVAGYHVTCSK